MTNEGVRRLGYEGEVNLAQKHRPRYTSKYLSLLCLVKTIVVQWLAGKVGA